MNNNDILRSLRYLLNVDEEGLVKIIKLADLDVTHTALAAMMKNEDDEGYQDCSDQVMAHLLGGMVILKRGKDSTREPQPIEEYINNNLVCKKLRIAYQLKDTDIISMVEKNGLKISKGELSGMFRAEGHSNYRKCGDQFLRYFLKGLAELPRAPAAALFSGKGS